MSNRVIIFDTTLRDGEQSPGATMNLQEKLRMARQLESLGVDVIEAGFPASSVGDFEAVHAIANAVTDVQVAALARCNKNDIDRAWQALNGARNPRIHVFLATSPIHMEYKLRKTPDQVVEMAVAAVRHAAFQVGSIISTTGFASTDFNLWPEFSRILLVLLMFIGACAGSTGGAIKCSRVLLLLKCIRREIRQVVHPRSVNVVKLDGRVVDEDSLRSVQLFFAAYLFIALGATLLVSVDNFSFGTTFTAVVSCIGNVGPGLELVGPMGNYSAFSGFSKLVLSLCMLIGRLEVLPVLVLFSRNAWKRS